MKVQLRKREKGNKVSLYLEYYKDGNREYEYLRLYLHPTLEKGRLTIIQKQHNKETLAIAEGIRAKRYLEIQNGIYGLQDRARLKGSFVKYVETLCQKRKNSKGNYGNWDSALKHLKNFAPHDVTFSQIDSNWVQAFKEYLQQEALTRAETLLSQNSKCSYFNKIRAALKQANKDGIILKNPADQVEGFQPGESMREFLTHDELQAMANAHCEIPVLKIAFLFSSMTGLRWSDIQKLTWSEVQHSKENGYYVRYTQQKTNGVETLPISNQAFSLLGERREQYQQVFRGLKYSAWHNIKLQQWALAAGISKTVTFHCARHTNATLQLTNGTDLYTVSKMLGHKHIKTTQIYAKVIDSKKREAANKISLSL
jgi:integrase